MFVGGIIVYIKKVTMKGFKSYGNIRVSVPLHKGFTCVVGPNGSGKSNIFDAISFVLGRMSAKSMRAGSTADLVFAGTDKQRPAEYSDVNIFFCNKEKEFPIDKEEVVISRRVDKSGKSVYRVNNKRETRTYVVDLLNIVGLTPDGYNMIAQGDITRFIKMSSFERRSIIEEISGIQEYDDKKDKGLRELTKAEENIARMDLVINEVSSQLKRLENEKNDALRYKYLKEEIDKNKGDLLYGELEEQTKEYEATTSSIEAKSKEITTLHDESEMLFQEIECSEELFSQKESEIETKSEQEYLKISRNIADITSSRDTYRARKEMKESSLQNTLQKRNSLKDSCLNNTSAIEEASTLIISLRAELETLDNLIKEKEESYTSIIESLEQTSNKFFEYKGESDTLEERITSLREKEYNLKNALTSFSERSIAIKERLQALNETIGSLDIDLVEEELVLAKSEHNEKEAKRSDLNVQSIREKEQELSNHLDAVERRLITLRSTITEIQSKVGKKKEARDVYGRNVSAIDEIMRLKDNGKFTGIIGKFSDLGTTKKEYSVALEVAAGSRMKNIVVEDSDVARDCIRYLKQNKLGRVTFIPLQDIQPRFNPERFSMNLEKDGAIDFAINLVTFKEEHRKAFEFVFSNTLIIKDIDVSKDMQRQRMVTLDGDIVEASGIITGGYWKPRRYLESFETEEDEEELLRLVHERDEFESKREKIRSELLELREAVEEASKEDAGLAAEIAAAIRKQSDLTRQLSAFRSREETLLEQIQRADADLKGQEKLIEEHKASLESLNIELNEALTQKEVIDGKVEEYRSEGIEKSQELGQLIAQKRKERETLVARIYSLESKVESLTSQNVSLEDEIASLYDTIDSLTKEISGFEKSLIEIEGELDLKREEEESILTAMKEIRGQRDSLRSKIFAMRNKREKTQQRSSHLEADIKGLEVQKASLEDSIDQLKLEVNEYSRSDKIVEDLKELRFRISRMEKEKEQLEPINMRAIEEYDEVETRYLLLSSKRDKLLEEKASILNFIGEIEKKKKNIFMQAFLLVKENFADIFGKVSPNGEGNLVLEDEEDPFSGGLFIEARPEGKELNRTESMSGGEKALTAIAFVFAIQRYKPAPFYILDEIDAHLDDDNVKRVSKLVKLSSSISQFIIITHRDVMMTTADRLFGTSISKNKISKIVSVELEKVNSVVDTERYGVAEG